MGLDEGAGIMVGQHENKIKGHDMEYISIKGAAQRLGLSEKEVNKLIQEGQLESKTEYGMTMVAKESVYGYSGISTEAKQTGKKEADQKDICQKKRGRPKGSLVKKTASVSAGVESAKFSPVEEGTLETVMQDKEQDVTGIDVGEIEVDEYCTYPECQCPFAMDADGACFKGLLNPVLNEQENGEIDVPKFEEAHKGVFSQKLDEDVITLTKRDFHASLIIAAMRAELGVYRSLKSFERIEG